MAIRKIEKSEIDFNKVYGTKASAMAQDNNTVKVRQEYWGDTGDLYFDDETGMVSEDGVGIGFINKNDLLSNKNEQNITPISGDKYSKIYDTKAAEAQRRLDERRDEISFEQTDGSTSYDTLFSSDNQLGDNEVESDVNSQIGIKFNVFDDEPINSIGDQLGINGSLDIGKSSEVDIGDIVPEAADTPTIEPITPIQTQGDQFQYSQQVHSKRQASDNIKASNGILTSNNQTYTILPDNLYTGERGTISQSDYNLLIAQVAGEGGNEIDDMLAVACTVFNRLESGGKGDTVKQVLQQGYFPFGETYRSYIPGGKYYNTPDGKEKLAKATQAVNDALNGIRNLESNVYYYSGNGVYNKFSDVL